MQVNGKRVCYFSKPGGSHCFKSFQSVAGGWEEPWSESVVSVHPETSSHRLQEHVAWDRTAERRGDAAR